MFCYGFPQIIYGVSVLLTVGTRKPKVIGRRTERRGERRSAAAAQRGRRRGATALACSFARVFAPGSVPLLGCDRSVLNSGFARVVRQFAVLLLFTFRMVFVHH